jgi:SAM-dependent methyltransferase
MDKAPGPRILDVGCSIGNVVAAAQSFGARAEGIDLDPVAVPRGQSLGRPIHNRDIAEQRGTWDGINLNHVLEHVVEPRPFLEHIARLAAPNAAVMIRVPHYRGLIPRLMGDNWFAWAPDEHVWHFTPETLVRTVEACTPLRCVEVCANGQIEPPSAGLKGRAKSVLANIGHRAGHGDQVQAYFTLPTAASAASAAA